MHYNQTTKKRIAFWKNRRLRIECRQRWRVLLSFWLVLVDMILVGVFLPFHPAWLVKWMGTDSKIDLVVNPQIPQKSE